MAMAVEHHSRHAARDLRFRERVSWFHSAHGGTLEETADLKLDVGMY